MCGQPCLTPGTRLRLPSTFLEEPSRARSPRRCGTCDVLSFHLTLKVGPRVNRVPGGSEREWVQSQGRELPERITVKRGEVEILFPMDEGTRTEYEVVDTPLFLPCLSSSTVPPGLVGVVSQTPPDPWVWNYRSRHAGVGIRARRYSLILCGPHRGSKTNYRARCRSRLCRKTTWTFPTPHSVCRPTVRSER